MHSHRHEDVPQTLVGISFTDVFRAQEFLTASARLASQGSMKVADAVILVKDARGQGHRAGDDRSRSRRRRRSPARCGPACSA